MDQHREAVAQIAAHVRGFYERKESFRIYHGATNSTRRSAYRRDQIIDTSKLKHVLHINKTTKTALVEPNVPMDALVEATLKHELIPPVVMELPGITVGGGFAGTAGESSSFKYGVFDCTINQIEIVLANGEVVTASHDNEEVDLFYGAAGSCGTLGVITLLEIQLIEAARFVELTYHPVHSVPEAIQKVEAESRRPGVLYLDGIIFSSESGVIMTGKLSNTCAAGMRVQRYTRAHDPWFYLHARKILAKNSARPTTEAVPLVDYLFRYDRGGFWGGAHAFGYFRTPFNRVTRWLLDYFMHTRVMYHALHESGLAEQTIVQDLALPFSTVQAFIEYIEAEFRFYPLWLCPIRPGRPSATTSSPSNHTSTPTSTSTSPIATTLSTPATTPENKRSFSMTAHHLPSSSSSPLLLNVGVWGLYPRAGPLFRQANRAIEQKLRALHGLKCLYAHAYYTEEEFWEIYDREKHDALRVRYHATSLPTVYDKVCLRPPTDEAGEGDEGKSRAGSGSRGWSWEGGLKGFRRDVWPLRGLYGVWRVLVGGEYLLRIGEKKQQKKTF